MSHNQALIRAQRQPILSGHYLSRSLIRQARLSSEVVGALPQILGFSSRPSSRDRGFNQRGNGSAFSAGGADKPPALATSICHERLSGANKRNSQIPSVINGQVKSQHSPKSFSYSNLCLTQPFSGTQTYWNTICGANSLPIPPRTADRFGPLMVTVRPGENRSPNLIVGDQRCPITKHSFAPNANRF